MHSSQAALSKAWTTTESRQTSTSSSAALEPVVGGMFTSHLTWRYYFYIKLLFGDVAVGSSLSSYLVLTVVEFPPRYDMEKLKVQLHRPTSIYP